MTTVDSVTCSPPSAAVNQPRNVYPSRVGMGSAPIAKPGTILIIVSPDTIPPLAFKVTVYIDDPSCITDIVRIIPPDVVTVIIPVREDVDLLVETV